MASYTNSALAQGYVQCSSTLQKKVATLELHEVAMVQFFFSSGPIRELSKFRESAVLDSVFFWWGGIQVEVHK